MIEYFTRHPRLAVASSFTVCFLIGLSLLPLSIEPLSLLSGTNGQVFGGFLVFVVINQYIVPLHLVPRVRKERGRDMSFFMAIVYAVAAPTLGLATIIPTGLQWPFWTCAALGLIGSVGPLSVLNMVGEKPDNDAP